MIMEMFTMIKLKKITVAVSLCIVAVLLFSACAKVIQNENFKSDGYIMIDGSEVVPEYLIKINGTPVSFAEYRYYYLNEKYELDGGDENVFDDNPELIDVLKEYTEDTLVEVYSIRALAEENGVQPDFKKVSDEIKGYKDEMSSAEFEKGLSAYYLTETLFEYILQGYELYDSLFGYYFGDDGALAMTDKEMLQYITDNYTHAKHILIYPNTTMSDSDYEAYLNEVLEAAHSSDDFDAVIAKYSDDDEMPEFGYYFADEEMPDEFVAACDMLEDGEISQLVKSSHGYHIIKKLSVDDADLSNLRDVVYNRIFAEIVDDKIVSAEVEYAPEYEYVSPFAVK